MEKFMDDALQAIRKRYGEEAIFLLNAFPKRDVKVISTGSMLLDWATDVGGIPRGRYTELVGTESTAKTTLSQHIVANAQKQGLTCAYIDVENSLDFDYAVACGVDFDSMYLAQPSFIEEALGITEELVKSGGVHVVVIDSVAAMMPEKVGDDEFHHENTAGMKRAAYLNDFFYRNTKYVRANDIAVIFTNQMRDNTKSQWGGYKGTGGHGLKHYASLRIRLSIQTKGLVKLGKEIVAQKVLFLGGRGDGDSHTAGDSSADQGDFKSGEALDPFASDFNGDDSSGKQEGEGADTGGSDDDDMPF